MKRVRISFSVSFFGLALLAGTAACSRPAAPNTRVSSAEVAASRVRDAVTPRVELGFVGAGSLEAKGESVAKTKLALERLGVTAVTRGDVAETSVEHVFRNDSTEVLEGTFRFPLPEGAMLTGLAMEIDGKLVDGELVERDKARKAYEQVVDQMLDPALLEWENGQTFKLRVFPIEPKKDKRVVIRFVAPLHRRRAGAGAGAPEDGLFFAFRPPEAEAGLSMEKTVVTVDGKRVPANTGREASGEVLVRTSAGAPPDVVVEKTKDAAYWYARLRPVDDGSSPPSSPAAGPSGQALIVLCDRSRSMLEARGLQKKTLGMLVDRLAPADRFTVIAGDVETRALVGGLREPLPPAKARALEHVDAIEPDGASDVAKLVAAAGPVIAEAKAAGLLPVVVYLGDGVATWGETRAAELERLTHEATGGATMHVVLLGKSTDPAAGQALAAGAHGRLLRPKTELDAERAAAEIVEARGKRRIEDVHLVGGAGLEVPSSIPSTLYEGDELSLAFRGKEAPKDDVTLVGTEGGRPFTQKLALDGAKPAGHVAQRWAKAKIEQLERDGDAHKEAIVKTSLEHGVMSRYTSFLVLDSEEAYAKYQIARKAKANANAEEARVSGNVDGDGRTASVTPDHLQPGDPEVRIPAPSDAQSVVVVFPFGETKTATYEPDDGAGHGGVWVVRFLVDRRTPDGTYEILARITHKDGRLELVRIPYVVDTQRPNLDVSVRRRRGDVFEIRATQRLTPEEVLAQTPNVGGTVGERRQQCAHVLTDAKRVEVRTPDGQTLSLTHAKLGEFVGTWTPTSAVPVGAKLRVVAVDRALNENVTEVEVTR
jgi:hypothetical protein